MWTCHIWYSIMRRNRACRYTWQAETEQRQVKSNQIMYTVLTPLQLSCKLSGVHEQISIRYKKPKNSERTIMKEICKSPDIELPSENIVKQSVFSNLYNQIILNKTQFGERAFQTVYYTCISWDVLYGNVPTETLMYCCQHKNSLIHSGCRITKFGKGQGGWILCKWSLKSVRLHYKVYSSIFYLEESWWIYRYHKFSEWILHLKHIKQTRKTFMY